MSQALKIIFAGTPDFAAEHLKALLNTHHEIIGVYTQPDRPAGRGKKLTASPVKKVAVENNLNVFQPTTFKTNETAQQELAHLHADIMVVVAYGLILPEVILNTPRLGCINVHGSVLPKWRGAAPIQRALWAGDTETGVTIMQLDKGMDTGDIIRIAKEPIMPTDTSETMYHKLALLGPQILCDTLDDISDGNITPQKQEDSLATYAQKLSKEEAKINWSDSAQHIERCIRAFNPWPISYFVLKEMNIKVWEAHIKGIDTTAPAGTILSATKKGICVATGEGILCITKLQIPGKKAMPVVDVLNSRKEWFEPNTQL